MYKDEEKGTYRLAVDEIDRSISEENNMILEKKAQVELAKTDKAAVEELFRLGYKGQNDVLTSRLKLLQAEDSMASATNNLKSFTSKREQLAEYEQLMKIKTLDGALKTAERELEQTKNNNESQLAQVEAAKIEAESVAAKEKERLENYQTQLEKCKIFAPHGGMVVYSREGRDGSTEIAEGVVVRERQRILSLPELTKMQVKTQVHEAVLDQVRRRTPRDHPDRRLSGSVALRHCEPGGRRSGLLGLVQFWREDLRNDCADRRRGQEPQAGNDGRRRSSRGADQERADGTRAGRDPASRKTAGAMSILRGVWKSAR